MRASCARAPGRPSAPGVGPLSRPGHSQPWHRCSFPEPRKAATRLCSRGMNRPQLPAPESGRPEALRKASQATGRVPNSCPTKNLPRAPSSSPRPLNTNSGFAASLARPQHQHPHIPTTQDQPEDDFSRDECTSVTLDSAPRHSWLVTTPLWHKQ